MKYTIINAPQRTAEWHAARAGRLTGSMAHTITMEGRAGKESVTRRDYILQLVAERISGTSQEKPFFNDEMQRGIDLEPHAFAAYEAQTGEMVRKTGFLQCDEVMAGCSLDGDVNGFQGIVEMKCPKMATHLAYLEDPRLLALKYMPQIAHNLWITGSVYCDVISFDDRLPKPKRLVRVRVERYNAGIREYEAAALAFLKEVAGKYSEVMADARV